MARRAFISYAHEDKPVARRLKRELEKVGVQVEIDESTLKPGDRLLEKVEETISMCDTLVAVVSPASPKSQWVLFEVGYAYAKGMRVIQYVTHKSLGRLAPVSGLFAVSSVGELREFFTEVPASGAAVDTGGVPRSARYLVVGQACWDTVSRPGDDAEERVGGTTYFASRAMSYAARHFRDEIRIDVCTAVGTDLSHRILPEYETPSIQVCEILQDRTLRMANQYRDPHGWEDRELSVLQLPERGVHTDDLPGDVVEALSQDVYGTCVIAPLTPHDFEDLAGAFVPFLRASGSNCRIALEMQGLTRGVSPEGGAVAVEVSKSLLHLIRSRAISCCHATIDEALAVLAALSAERGDRCTLRPDEASLIALELCKYGIDTVGLTDGGRGSWVAWKNSEKEYSVSHISARDIAKGLPAYYGTGAGDTWFGCFIHFLLGTDRSPDEAGRLATAFATMKCEQDGALGGTHV